MADRKGQDIPTTSNTRRKQHWWFEEQRYTPDSGDSPISSSPPGNSSLSSSPDPKAAIPLPSIEGWSSLRRYSLKNSYLLDDFATPE
jgi:hypothetical protein